MNIPHADYPHEPGTLPDCPACDREMERRALDEIRSGGCPQEAMLLLSAAGRRRVETAARVLYTAKASGQDLREALHFADATDDNKSIIAEWLGVDPCDWTGSLRDRIDARRRAEDRVRDRQADQILATVAELDPDDDSFLAALRESAASIRDHRAAALIRQADGLRDAAEAAREQALEAFSERDHLWGLALQEQENGNWTAAASHATGVRIADARGNAAVHRQIKNENAAKELEVQVFQYLDANRRYDERWGGR